MSDLLTPSQTVGPFLSIGLTWKDGHLVVPEGTPGAIRWSGRRHGADTHDVLTELGVGAGELERLRAEGIV